MSVNSTAGLKMNELEEQLVMKIDPEFLKELTKDVT